MATEKQIEAVEKVLLNYLDFGIEEQVREIATKAIEAYEQAAWTEFKADDESTHPKSCVQTNILVIANDIVSQFESVVYFEDGEFYERYVGIFSPIVERWKYI